MKLIILAWSFAVALIFGVASQAQDLRLAPLGDFPLKNGEVIRDFKIGYRTLGKLNAEKSNAVLFPTWFTGKTKDLVGLVGPGKLCDPSKYFVILVDAIGDGVSSSPSTSALQPRMHFPHFTLVDMVTSQHELLIRELKISHLRAVMGISMGGMQTFQWVVSYPDFMDKAIPIVGSPRLTSFDLLLWQAELHAIEADKDWKNGDYPAPPAGAMKTVADIHTLALNTPAYVATHISRQDFPDFLAKAEKETAEHFDTNDWVRQLQAMMDHDLSRSFAGSMENTAAAVHAQMLITVGMQDVMVNPRPALAFAKLVHAETLELDSDCGHLAVGCEAEKVNSTVARFLEK